MQTGNKITDDKMLWGEMYEPSTPKQNSGRGIRIVLFVSCDCGNSVLNQVASFEKKHPDLVNIVGVVTDDPVDPRARISLKKRIWSQFTPAQRTALKGKIINSAVNNGIACYTGAVKTDYFRHIYQKWNPEVLIMFCYGQKLDAFIYQFPKLGAYNLHPSDLPKHIGAGTQPFQNAMRNGLKTSPLVIHHITELIDMGHIVGVSSPVSICLKDGSYPKSLLTLLNKITSIGGWMSIQLISQILNNEKNGRHEPVVWIDFDSLLPVSIKAQLMSPATDDIEEMYEIPLHPLLTE
jgi:methionyl-tRNA formyltransferase